jgi:hypothetical protein
MLNNVLSSFSFSFGLNRFLPTVNAIIDGHVDETMKSFSSVPSEIKDQLRSALRLLFFRKLFPSLYIDKDGYKNKSNNQTESFEITTLHIVDYFFGFNCGIVNFEDYLRNVQARIEKDFGSFNYGDLRSKLKVRSQRTLIALLIEPLRIIVDYTYIYLSRIASGAGVNYEKLFFANSVFGNDIENFKSVISATANKPTNLTLLDKLNKDIKAIQDDIISVYYKLVKLLSLALDLEHLITQIKGTNETDKEGSKTYVSNTQIQSFLRNYPILDMVSSLLRGNCLTKDEWVDLENSPILVGIDLEDLQIDVEILAEEVDCRRTTLSKNFINLIAELGLMEWRKQGEIEKIGRGSKTSMSALYGPSLEKALLINGTRDIATVMIPSNSCEFRI